MVSGEVGSNLIPGRWVENLPGSCAGYVRNSKLPAELVNRMDDVVLEISRSSIIMRGGPLLFAILGLFCFFAYFLLLIKIAFPLDREVIAVVFVFPVLLLGASWIVLLLFKTDLGISSDRPVRFNRALKKIYVYEHSYSLNPFREWPVTVKIFDWSDVDAKIYCYKGFTGKVYMQRFSLWLIDRGRSDVSGCFQLMGNWPTTKEMHDAWDYCVEYMESGVSGVPACEPRNQDVTFRRSLFHYMRMFDPTKDGEKMRSRMTAGDWSFNFPFLLLTFWLFLPMGVAHYFAMRFSPAVKWPEAVDNESLSN